MALLKSLGSFLLLLQTFVSSHHDRIIGGDECPENEHRSLVQLLYFDEPYCGATLLNENWVITAAHCNMSHIQVMLGEHDNGVWTGREQLRFAIETVVPDPTVRCENTCENDIMLIKLDSPAVYDNYVSPLDLATTCAPVGTPCTVMGWGLIESPGDTYPTAPHCVDVEILPCDNCEAAYGDKMICKKMTCAGDINGGKDSCGGDSGGPLICDGELHGIVSFGADLCGQPNWPGVYTKICKYLDWIQSTIA